MGGMAIINEEVSVLVNWHNIQFSQQMFSVPDTTELILAVGITACPKYENNIKTMQSLGFKQNPKYFINPNTSRRLSFFAAERQDLNEKVFSFHTPKQKPNFLHLSTPYQYFPACCGLLFLTDPLSRNRDSINQYRPDKIGLICIVENSQQKEIDHLINELGFVPAYYLSTKTIFYKHFAKERLA